MVDPADEIHVAVCHPARQIACAVQPLSGDERAVCELLRVQLGTVQVPAGHARSADAELTEYADRYRVQMRIHDVEAGVQPRFADRHAALLRQECKRLIVVARIDRRFGYAVAVDDSKL